ncbi:hypothetical protein MKY08_06035 [Lysinibacillus sp. FSL M8-0337]|uniref:hypothetical protein n=1 Tax=Lysinibacillus TaxID=400634 RepID=UPI00084A5273|nr:hypothetical protein [Lysinibacillus sphaericus]
MLCDGEKIEGGVLVNADIQFLKDLQTQMKWEDEHDYDSQASPRFWVLMDYREVPANEDYDDGFDSYFHNDGEHTEFRNFDELKDFIEEYYEDEVDDYLQSLLNDESKHFDTLWAHIENHLNDCGFFSKVFCKREEFIVQDTMFLTKEEAKRHLELNHYHYTKEAHTYAMTAWRAPKVARLLNILMSFNWDSVQVKEGESVG